MEDQEKNTWEEEKKPKSKHFVTRREFYICMVILLAAVIWQGNRISHHIQDKGNEIQNNLQSKFSSQIGQIPSSIERAMEEADNPLRESRVTVAGRDSKMKTVTIAMKAVPKTYADGMTMTFFLSCDGKEPIAIAAEGKADRSFVAEREIPICESVEVKAVVRQGGTEQIQNLNGFGNLTEIVYPSIDGYINYSIKYGSENEMTFEDCYVYFNPPDRLEYSEEDTENFQLQEANAEVFCNGKMIEKIPLKRVEDTPYENQGYEGTGKEKIHPKEGDAFTVIFKGVSRTGIQYQYILEKGTWNTEETPNGTLESTVDRMRESERLTIQ